MDCILAHLVLSLFRRDCDLTEPVKDDVATKNGEVLRRRSRATSFSVSR